MRNRISDDYGAVVYCNPYDSNMYEKQIAFDRVQNYHAGIGYYGDELAEMRQAQSNRIIDTPTANPKKVTPGFIEDAILQQTIVKERDMSIIGEAKLKLAQEILGKNGVMVSADIPESIQVDRPPVPRKEIIQQRREDIQKDEKIPSLPEEDPSEYLLERLGEIRGGGVSTFQSQTPPSERPYDELVPRRGRPRLETRERQQQYRTLQEELYQASVPPGAQTDQDFTGRSTKTSLAQRYRYLKERRAQEKAQRQVEAEQASRAEQERVRALTEEYADAPSSSLDVMRQRVKARGRTFEEYNQ